MAERKEKRGLGRGLSALMADVDLSAESSSEAKRTGRTGSLSVPVENIRPNPDQPRRDFDKDALNELAGSISEKGVIQPLVVRVDPENSDKYQIVAGERRWRAAQIAKLHELPVVVREFSDTEVLEIAIIENIQRADLNPVEEALGFQQLQNKFGHTQEQLAQALGKSRSHIANMLRLLNLPDAILSWMREGKLTIGHARALITAENPVDLARQVIAKGLSVRDTEKLAKRTNGNDAEKISSRPASTDKDADTRALEGDLSANLGMKVDIDHDAGKESGKLSISYKDFNELDELCRRLISLSPG